MENLIAVSRGFPSIRMPIFRSGFSGLTATDFIKKGFRGISEDDGHMCCVRATAQDLNPWRPLDKKAEGFLFVAPGVSESEAEELSLLISRFGFLKIALDVQVSWVLFVSERPEVSMYKMLISDYARDRLLLVKNSFTVNELKSIITTSNPRTKIFDAIAGYIHRECPLSVGMKRDLDLLLIKTLSRTDGKNLVQGIGFNKTVREILFPTMDRVCGSINSLSKVTSATSLHYVALLLMREVKSARAVAIGAKMQNDQLSDVFPGVNWPTVCDDFVISMGIQPLEIDSFIYLPKLASRISAFNKVLLESDLMAVKMERVISLLEAAISQLKPCSTPVRMGEVQLVHRLARGICFSFVAYNLVLQHLSTEFTF
ncbi:hypothetical protein LUZ63_014721 [Rhynchospora breviuscula]|uniref:Uncharacterized protein n=1 Tax=Rhynchospora breviuscula TaxID=2022672 RepID=A0A9Q0HLD4_9POAL|nr:hypothetical protein LUZ63_014721 [Rhynchospora breviuscula]